jgi:hypothetical protein
MEYTLQVQTSCDRCFGAKRDFCRPHNEYDGISFDIQPQHLDCRVTTNIEMLPSVFTIQLILLHVLIYSGFHIPGNI